ncbi:hypothetical protein DV704_06710 [Meiothermus sp. QL-1]|uniref:hypothetical protein n=1 Tax=Meiothermus sp. QL-1 TaxID=2058095 RepID=UPI000E0BEA0F|nr:hypothetical protein [Meiothermus sp. QL-1]RDI95567.1 hypothetical protein DV704_06710 [Meiothermus sp. QL-1]
MKKALIFALLGGIAFAQPGTSPFVDVPPCHWAREAIEAIARPDPNARPQPSALLAENALRQVFEGLRCNDPLWSQRFLQDPSPAFGRAEARLRGFELNVRETRIAGERATLRFDLTAVLAEGSLRRSGTAQLVFTPAGWRVVYSSLVDLGLPLFPQ